MNKSLYRTIIEQNNTNSWIGYDYKGNILKKSMSNKMFSGNKLVYEFLMKLDGIIYQLFDNVKAIKNIMSIARDKHDRNYN